MQKFSVDMYFTEKDITDVNDVLVVQKQDYGNYYRYSIFDAFFPTSLYNLLSEEDLFECCKKHGYKIKKWVKLYKEGEDWKDEIIDLKSKGL